MSAFLLVFLLFSVLVPIPSLSVPPTVSEASSWEDYPDYPLPLPEPEDPLTLENIHISSDGTITPSDAPITVEEKEAGLIFRLTRDLILTGRYYQIGSFLIKCGLFIEAPEEKGVFLLDGGGHVITGPSDLTGICVMGASRDVHITNISVVGVHVGIRGFMKKDFYGTLLWIYKTRMAGNSVGIIFMSSNLVGRIINNIIDQNELAGLDGISYTIVMGNVFAFNGLSFDGSCGITPNIYVGRNVIVYNKFINNKCGINLGEGNYIFFNSFINNEEDDVRGDEYYLSRNVFYDESRGLGNYWSSYAQGCSDVDGDFVCDDPYYYGDYELDKYPLKVPVEQLPDPPVDDIFIFPDGSVWPSWAQITRTSSNYYVLTRDLTPPRSKPTLIIMKPGITVDGGGHLLKYELSQNGDQDEIPPNRVAENLATDSKATGIYFILFGDFDTRAIDVYYFAENVTIKNFVIEGYPTGINSFPATGITIAHNVLRNILYEGIKIGNPARTNIRYNIVENADVGIDIYGFRSEEGGEPNVLIEYNVLQSVWMGVGVEHGDIYNVVVSCNFINVGEYEERFSSGIVSINSGRLTAFGNRIENVDVGVSIYFFGSANITKNILRKNYYGVDLYYSSDVVVSSNNITENIYGIRLFMTSDNVFIYHNVFANNSKHVSLSWSTAIWDNGYPDGGNFWDDFSPVCVDSDSDGICDDPYVIDDNNIDRYPLARVPSWSLPDVCPSAEEPGTGEAPGEGGGGAGGTPAGGGVGTGRSGGMGGKALTTPETIIAIPTLITAATTATILLRRKR